MGNVVLDNLAFDPDAANISYRDIRYVLIRPETVAEIYRQIDERYGDSVREVFFQAAYRAVLLSMQTYARTGAPTSGEEFVAFMTEMAGHIGWGKVSIVSLDPDRREIVLEVNNSAFAYRQAGENHPVCDALRGAFAATAEALWKTSVSSKEVTCAAMGDDLCRFVIAAAEPR